LIIVSVAFAGCTWNVEPEPYREKLATDVVANLLIDEYTTRYGALAKRCEDHLYNVVYVERGEQIPDTATHMGTDNEKARGEHTYDGVSYIWIDESVDAVRYNTFLVHEQIHALLACESDPSGFGIGDGDGDHNEPNVWCTVGYGCRFDGHDDTDSLEYAVAEMVRYYGNN